jgi:hypothetical protein
MIDKAAFFDRAGASRAAASRGTRRNSVQRSTNGCLQIVEFDESIRLASQFVGDHRWFAPQTGNDGDVDASALHGFDQRAEIPIAGKQHDVIDLVCDLKRVDSKFDAHAALELAGRPSPSSNSFAGFVTTVKPLYLRISLMVSGDFTRW